MEEERTREQEADAARQREARARAQSEAMDRVRRDLEARERAEAEARREAERREREEQLRAEAARRAAMEAVRMQVEARARLEEGERQRRHELELERVRALAGGRRTPSAVAVLGGAVLTAVIAAGAYWGVVAPGERARAAEAAGAMATRDATIGDLVARANAADERIRSLERDLASAAADNKRLQAEADDAKRQGSHRVPGRSPAVTGTSARQDRVPDGFAAQCPPGSRDPMCLH